MDTWSQHRADTWTGPASLHTGALLRNDAAEKAAKDFADKATYQDTRRDLIQYLKRLYQRYGVRGLIDACDTIRDSRDNTRGPQELREWLLQQQKSTDKN
jgi:hypothetical protein